MRILLCCLSVLLVSTHAHAARSPELSAEMIRLELADVRQALHAAQVNMELLEERIRKQEIAAHKPSKDAPSLMEKKIASLENDLRQLATRYQEATAKIATLESLLQTHERRFNEVVKLKDTLTSISQTLTPSNKTHRVQAGDSLEKIARQHKTTIGAIKELNQLKSDQIKIGQTLQIPHE